MYVETRQPTSIVEVVSKIMANPESRAVFMAEYNRFIMRRRIKWIIGIAVAVTFCIIVTAMFTACTARQTEQPTQPQERVIESEIVLITVTGNRTVVRELATDRIHNFTLTTTRHRGEAPPTQTRTHTSTDVVRIYSRGAVLVVYEVETSVIHLV